ncbi:ABC transporter permease subunit [Alicyclobacillus cycloheptanicus]|uniref:Molybdate/tungstate transport system permease protein n=1 Tax=Alicyclobacillus cycloheptanicus TaxID=1457 RepID=A0ABT9XNL9_9BACL|nr:ABC transporter permease subunit [Alicyclobacillus cycloheptanicus]MDQ0191296.1 molybdate/tungstate transport system permease protein [Alicyclobacillus cycloheptanicus]WDM02416.1 ABC transporter permease subunit [Alicyclobacillus cycloheptanicus]
MRIFSTTILILAALAATSFLLLPVIALLLHVSWPGLWGIWTTYGGEPWRLSLETTLITMLIVLVVGTPIGWLLARGKSRLWKLVEYLLLIPLLMPPLVIGLLLVYFYGPYGFIGGALAHWHIAVLNTALAVVIAQVYEAIPYYIFSVQGALRQVDPGYERLSYSLGVPPGRTFWRVTLPLAMPGVTVGLTMAFARAIGAYGAIIVVAYNPHTLPVSIWVALEEQGLPVALPLALLLLVTALPLPLATVLWRRNQHAAAES